MQFRSRDLLVGVALADRVPVVRLPELQGHRRGGAPAQERPPDAGAVVEIHHDDGAIKARIAHRGRRDQKLTGERHARRRLGRGRQRDVETGHRQQNDREIQDQAPLPSQGHEPVPIHQGTTAT